MGNRLYVGNIPFSTDEDTLNALFAQGGRTVAEVHIVSDRTTGRPRGFAFVEMGSEDDAQAAIKAIDGTEIDGRAVQVNEAKERPRGGGGR